MAGLNLYNNGFSGGLIAIVLYPTIMAIWRKGRLILQDEDYYDLFEESDPIDVSSWRTSKSVAMEEKKKAEEENARHMEPPEEDA